MTARPQAAAVTGKRGPKYDSDDLPVLIRLPNLRDVESAATRKESRTRKRGRRPGGLSTSNNLQRPGQEASKVSKTPFGQQAGNKLVLGGVFGGILVVVLLLLFNASGPTPPANHDAWASQEIARELTSDEPEVLIPSTNEAPPLYPAATPEAPISETRKFASRELDRSAMDVPYDEPATRLPTAKLALPTKPQAVRAWPSEDTMVPSPQIEAVQTDWPSDSLSLEPGGYHYPYTESRRQGDVRSSMNPFESESYPRMGKLDSDRQQAIQVDRSSNVLNGNIEIPDTTSFR